MKGLPPIPCLTMHEAPCHLSSKDRVSAPFPQLLRMKMEILEKTFGLLLKALLHYHPKKNIPL
jgi:hypothetical protein